MCWMRIQTSLSQADLLTLTSASRENTVYLLEHPFLPAKCSSWGRCYKSHRRSFQWLSPSCLQTQEYPWWGKIMWLLQAGGSWHTLSYVRLQLVIAWFEWNDLVWKESLISFCFLTLKDIYPDRFNEEFFMDTSPQNMIIATTKQCVWKKELVILGALHKLYRLTLDGCCFKV